MRPVAWLICIHTACAADYWMAWPDHYARGGGLGNQLEQIMGRVQCAGDAARTLVLPDLRADRSSMRGDARHHAFEDVFDIQQLRTVANVATWRAMLRDCNQEVSFVVEGSSPSCDAFEVSLVRQWVICQEVVTPSAVDLNAKCDSALLQMRQKEQ